MPFRTKMVPGSCKCAYVDHHSRGALGQVGSQEGPRAALTFPDQLGTAGVQERVNTSWAAEAPVVGRGRSQPRGGGLTCGRRGAGRDFGGQLRGVSPGYDLWPSGFSGPGFASAVGRNPTLTWGAVGRVWRPRLNCWGNRRGKKTQNWAEC